MTTYYEVWDDATGNRVGGAFETQAQAEELLHDVLRINGPDAARDMAILAFHPGRDGRHEAMTVLEGTDFVARHVAHAEHGLSRIGGV